MPAPEEALLVLARELRDEESVISPQVTQPDVEPVLGLLVAAGPRAAAAPGEYAVVIEAVREGYLLHYGEPRLLSGADDDLALLAGDYLYALGLERLAVLGDLQAVSELADLISLCARIHADAALAHADASLWLACATAVAVEPRPAHETAKDGLRAGRPEAVAELERTALATAAQAGLVEPLRRVAEAIGFRSSDSR